MLFLYYTCLDQCDFCELKKYKLTDYYKGQTSDSDLSQVKTDANSDVSIWCG